MQKSSTRTVPMEVLALGMSRSGTESVCRALLELGYHRTYHGMRDLNTGQDGFIWGELTERKYGKNPQPITRDDLDRVLGDCMAVTDMPCVVFWSELMDAYADAKILLVERDLEAWHHSMDKVMSAVFSWRADLLHLSVRLGLLPPNPNLFITKLGLGYFNARNGAELLRNARSVYREHYDAIEARAKSEGRPVLRIRLEEANWDVICRFLGKQRPEVPFPRGNEWQKTAAFTKQYQWTALKVAGWNLVKVVLGTGIGVGVVAWAVMR